MTGIFGGLSARLLVLTLFFVMVAEILIYAPSIARFRLQYLEEHLAAAHLAVLALEATPDGMVDAPLQRKLLTHAEAVGITVHRPGAYKLMLGSDMPEQPDAYVDLRQGGFFTLIADALAVLARSDDRLLAVAGPSPKDRAVLVEVFVREDPLRHKMLAYSRRILGLSVFISVATAALVYFSLHWLMVRPMRRLTASMIAFREAPEDPSRIIRPTLRTDEIGVAQRALSAMQEDLREALGQRQRLAGLGTAVAKISHDLKNVLATAMLESDRLEYTAGADPEVRHITAGICRSLDRAVGMCNHTLRFAKEGPPKVDRGRHAVREVVEAVADAIPVAGEGRSFANDVSPQVVADMDPVLMARVLDNLLRNAVEAGARSIRVTAGNRGGDVWLEVSDDGPGLPPRAIKNLFQPFSGSARAGGTGLGLPIARELAAAQGGTLALLKTGPGGTTFGVRLPKPSLA